MADIEISQMTPWTGVVTGNIEFPAIFAGQNYKIALSQITPSTFGFGDMALQNSNTVSITGGNVAVTALSGAIDVINGGTGNFAVPNDGELLIGNGAGYTIAALTAGTNITITNGPGSITIDAADQFTGTVTSVDVSGGTTGLTFTGGPITTNGTITAGGTLATASGGTGQTTYTNGQLLVGKNDGTLAKATLTAGTGISVTNGDGSITITNSAPDQTVALTAGAGVVITGTYPSFTIATTGGSGTVTSVDVSGGTTGLTFTGGPVTTSGTITASGTLAVAHGGTGQTSYTNGQLLIGNSTGNTLDKATLTAGTGISVTNGAGAITITNSAPDQTVSLTGAGTTAISGTYPNFTITSNDDFVGTVTSVDVSGGTTGLTFSGGPVTSSGTITLAGTLAIANGGTNGTAAPTSGAVAYGTGTAYGFTTAGTQGQVLLSNGSSAPAFGGIDGGTF